MSNVLTLLLFLPMYFNNKYVYIWKKDARRTEYFLMQFRENAFTPDSLGKHFVWEAEKKVPPLVVRPLRVEGGGGEGWERPDN